MQEESADRDKKRKINEARMIIVVVVITIQDEMKTEIPIRALDPGIDSIAFKGIRRTDRSD